MLAAVSAPSSLAVDLAGQAGLTLVAFLRGKSMNVYTRPDRVATDLCFAGGMTRDEITEQIIAARLAKGLTWQHLADAVERPVVWTTAALLGQHPIPPEPGAVLVEMLGLDPPRYRYWPRCRMRGGSAPPCPTDPDDLPLLRGAFGVRRRDQGADPRTVRRRHMSAITYPFS